MNGRKGGRPKGSASEKTARVLAEKEAIRAEIRAFVKPRIQKWLHAQGAAAEGLKYQVAREKGTGKFRHLTKELSKAITSGQNNRYDIIEVWQKFPSTAAFEALLNRAIDKPGEQVTVEGDIDHEMVIRWKTDEDGDDD